MVCANLIRLSNREINVMRYSAGEGSSHRAIKEDICRQLEKQNKKYITEAIFKKVSLIADILVLDDLKGIEIAVSESDESIENKKKLYEKIGLRCEVIRC